MIEILPINAFEDNYIWLVKKEDKVLVVDPGDATPVLNYLEQEKLTLSGILITHHHSDHIGGVKTLCEYQDVPVYAPSYGSYAFKHRPVSDNTLVTFDDLSITFKVIWLPGHTKDHIAFQYQQHLFCGDVIFGAGCGRIFDGTLEEQYTSLNKIKALPEDTLLYCAHEYTQHNIAFALTLDPQNKTLIERQNTVLEMRDENQSTVPLLLKTELETNPFLRCHTTDLKQQNPNLAKEDFIFFSQIRALRNHY